MEGYGEKVAKQKGNSAHLQKYIEDHVPMMMQTIEAIHSSVSNDDVLQLQSQLEFKDHMVLAKDALGMAPIHRSVLMNKVEALKFLIERFPETLNAKDKEGRTALHYAAAMSRSNNGSANLYRMLLEAGADSRIRDNQGRSAEYYRTHHVPIPNKLAQLPKAEAANKKLRSKSEPPPHQRNKRRPLGPPGASEIPQATSDKINQWLQNGDVEKLKEYVHEGFGRHLLGRTSWNEDVRQYLKTIPTYLINLEALFTSAASGDVDTLDRLLSSDEKLLKARDEKGSTIVHQAVQNNRLNVINYFLGKHPSVINLRDKLGRTPLHIAGQQKHEYFYNVLLSAGADSMILDNKGRYAEFYLNSTIRFRKPKGSSSEGTPEDSNEDRVSDDAFKPNSNENKREEELKNQSEEETKVEEDEEKEEIKEEENINEEEKQEESKPSTEEQLQAEEMFEDKIENNEPDEVENNEGAPEDEQAEEEIEEQKEEEEPALEENNEEETEENAAEEQEVNPDEVAVDDNKENEDDDDDYIRSRELSSVQKRRSSSGDRLNELIDLWIREKDLLRLEHVVIAGQGDRLVGRMSDDRQVQEFLELVPTYMARIRGVHDAVVRGNLGEVESVLTRKRFALSRDHLGASPLHLAVLHGHTDIVQYIVNNFPEALDGPDNEGRTPLHYAAVVRDGGNCYRMLKRSGADEAIVDKNGQIAEYYLTHPGALTIRDLLESYRIPDPEQRRPSQVNIWQRPPTQGLEHPISPPYAASPFDMDIPNPRPEDDFPDRDEHIDHDHHKESGDDISHNTTDESTTEIFPETIYPILFDRQNRDSAYLATVLGDALIKGLTHVAKKRPDDPVGYLATWLYQYATKTHQGTTSGVSRGSQKSAESNKEGSKSENEASSPVEDEDDEFANDADDEGKESKEELSECVKNILGEDARIEEFLPKVEDADDMDLEFDDHTKMKDEQGQTVLHFAASKLHPNGSFYGLLSQAESLIAERDFEYRTCRDMALDLDQQDNVEALDRFVFDAYIQQRSPILHMLAHEGYDELIHVTDAQGRDIAMVLQQRELKGAIGLLKDIADFIKIREELHTFIRHSYLEGVNRLIRRDPTLVTAKNHKARCALHIAVLYEHIDVIEALVKSNSASVHVPDNLGRTPLHYAMAMRRVEQIAKILVKAGAIRTVRDVNMRTPSYYFIYKDDIQKLYEEELRHA